MPIGYTLIDPFVVICGTAFALFLVLRSPVKLIFWTPAALSFYFFIPFVTLLTLWQTVPLIMAARAFVKRRVAAASFAQPVFLAMIVATVFAGIFALLLGADKTRAGIRFLYYFGLFGLASFAYEMGRKRAGYPLLIKGLAITGVALAAYGVYQVFALQTGLPFRAIVRGIHLNDVAFEGSFMRINSLANEPKRLGYVLMVCALACWFWGQSFNNNKLGFKVAAVFVLSVSIFTFSGSYFFSIAIFVVLASIMYVSNAIIYIGGTCVLFALASVVAPELVLYDVLIEGLERRLNEVDVGLDGEVVYRQEFFAWDYMQNNISDVPFGLGLGQYYSTLADAYGFGVGLSETGRLLPINSSFLEMILDLGGVATGIFYGSMIILTLTLRRKGEHFLCLALLFLVIQSFTIVTLHFMILISCVGLARLQNRAARAQRKPLLKSPISSPDDPGHHGASLRPN